MTMYTQRQLERVRRLLQTWSFPSVRALHLGCTSVDAELVRLLAERCGVIERLHYTAPSEDDQASRSLFAAFPAVTAMQVTVRNARTHLAFLLEQRQLTDVTLLCDIWGLGLPLGSHPYAQAWPALRRLRLEGLLEWRGVVAMLAAPESLTSLTVVSDEVHLDSLTSFVWWRCPNLTHFALCDQSFYTRSSPLPVPDLLDGVAQHQDRQAQATAAATAPRSKRNRSAPLESNAAAVALSPALPAHLLYPALLSLNLRWYSGLSERSLWQLSVACPSLTSLDVSNNKQLGKQALLLALSPTAFPSLTALHASGLRRTAFTAVTDPSCSTNSTLRLLHLADARSSEPCPTNSTLRLLHLAAEGLSDFSGSRPITKEHVQALSARFPRLTSLDLSHRHHLRTPALLRLLISLPQLRELKLLRMQLCTVSELEDACVQFSHSLRDVYASITGVLSALEASRVKGGRMVREGRVGDHARREWSAEAQERVWLRTACRVTLHIDVEGVHRM